MESVLETVEKHCGSQLSEYGKCIDDNQPNFESPCLALKRALTQCAEVNVSAVREVKERCAPQIGSYEQCVSANPGDAHIKCGDLVKALYRCTHEGSMAAAHSMAGVNHG